MKALLLGASGHAKVVLDIVSLLGWEVVGVVADDPALAGTRFCGVPVLGDSGGLAALRPGVANAVVGIGAAAHRLDKARLLLSLGFDLPVAVHPRAVVAASAVLEPGTVVMAGAVVNPGAHVGFCGIVNTGATVDHDCVLAEGVQVAPGAHLAGNVRVGPETFIGMGANVIEGVTLGGRAVVGAGAAVIRDVPDGVLAVGVPARIVMRS